jgi:hypothetical protein
VAGPTPGLTRAPHCVTSERTAATARSRCGSVRSARWATASSVLASRSPSGTSATPPSSSSVTGSGTVATPRPPAARVTRVEVSSTSCRVRDHRLPAQVADGDPAPQRRLEQRRQRRHRAGRLLAAGRVRRTRGHRYRRHRSPASGGSSDNGGAPREGESCDRGAPTRSVGQGSSPSRDTDRAPSSGGARAMCGLHRCSTGAVPATAPVMGRPCPSVELVGNGPVEPSVTAAPGRSGAGWGRAPDGRVGAGRAPCLGAFVCRLRSCVARARVERWLEAAVPPGRGESCDRGAPTRAREVQGISAVPGYLPWRLSVAPGL